LQDGVWAPLTHSEISYPAIGNTHSSLIEEQSFWFKHRNNCITSLVRRYYKGSEIFDIGGGNGFVSAALAKEGYEPVLIEPGLQGIINGRSRGLKNLVHGSLQDMKLIAGSIPAAGFFDVLEHIEDEKGFLMTVSAALKPGGLAFITVPAFNFLWSDEDVYTGHFRRYRRWRLHALFGECGFEGIYSTYFFSFLVPAIFLIKSIPSYFGLRSGSEDLEKVQKDHQAYGLADVVLNRIWDWEHGRIRAASNIPFGSSILGVFRKL
jgi:SAM-dependent methyltransferase